LRKFVTRTLLPNGRSRWAAVISYILNLRPLAVRWPWRTVPYQLAMPLLMWLKAVSVVLDDGAKTSSGRMCCGPGRGEVGRAIAGMAVSLAKADKRSNAAIGSTYREFPIEEPYLARRELAIG
jgi:hypothetical protein